MNFALKDPTESHLQAGITAVQVNITHFESSLEDISTGVPESIT